MDGQEHGWGREGLGGQEWGPLQPPCPLCPQFLLSREGEPKRQTRTRILKHEAKWKGPRGRARKEQDLEPVQGAERREQRERRTRNSEVSRRALGSRCQGTGWERENRVLS